MKRLVREKEQGGKLSRGQAIENKRKKEKRKKEKKKKESIHKTTEEEINTQQQPKSPQNQLLITKQ